MSVIEQGATLGVLGGGQLGRMFVEAAHRLGYGVSVLAAESGSPAGQIADFETVGNAENAAEVVRFAQSVAALTFENELVPWESLLAASDVTTVRPGPYALRVAQDRILQRRFLTELDLPVARFSVLERGGDLEGPVSALTFPVCLKSARSGYDGRGQWWAHRVDEVFSAWSRLDFRPVLVEERVDLEVEFSVILARGADGAVVTYEPIENVHSEGVLDTSKCPSGISAETAAAARKVAETIACRLDIVGVLATEFFVTANGQLLINEFAVRPHNSGHLTIEACQTSQFEQQVRALVGLPLGCPALVSAGAMTNLLGPWQPLAPPESLPPLATLHGYGKEPAPRRKMGHITALGDNPAGALRAARVAREMVTRGT